MVGVAQLVEPRIVIPAVVGSSPIVHPILSLFIPSQHRELHGMHPQGGYIEVLPALRSSISTRMRKKQGVPSGASPRRWWRPWGIS
jgi:hypothetical protein